MNVSVIIPACNDEDALPLVLRTLPREVVQDVVVVDNGSTDRTFAVAQAANVKVVFEPRRGYGQACQSGVRAIAPESDVVVFMDGGHADDPADLPALLAPIAEGRADVVIGSRVLGHAEPGSLTPQQRVGNWLACRLLAWRFGQRFTDLGPLRAIRREVLVRLQLRTPGIGWLMEMQVKALRARLRIVEVPVRYRRRMGRSNVSGTLVGSVRAGVAMLSIAFRYW